MKRSRTSEVTVEGFYERRAAGRITMLRSISTATATPKDSKTTRHTQTDKLKSYTTAVQASTKHLDKSTSCSIAPTDRYKFLDETEKLYLRVGETFVNLDLKDLPTLDLSGKVKSSGDDVLRNILAVTDYIKNLLGNDAKSTPFRSSVESAAALSGVHRTTIKRHSEKPVIPSRRLQKDLSKKQRNRRAASRLSLLNRFKVTKRIHEMWKNGNNVTIESVLEWAKANIGYSGGRTNFYHIIKGMGFCDRKRNLDTVIDERVDIIKSRAVFLKKKEEMDRAGFYFGATDETWNHNGMTKNTAWQHNNSDLYRRSRMVDLDTPVAGPSKGKHRGTRGIVLAVLTEDGVLPGSETVLVSGVKIQDQKLDYHQEMSGDTFEAYFKEFVPLLKAAADKQGRPAAVLVDNASYHNKALERPPTANAVKADIIQFLQKHNVPHHIGQLKKDLVQIMTSFLKSNGGRAAFTVYELDEWALGQGVQVLRLPPYHCFWNPIELLWAQMKHHLRSLGCVSDSLQLVRQRTLDFLKSFPAEEARKLLEHTRKDEHEVREMMKERESTIHDESFRLSYEHDEAGNLINIHISEDEDEYDDFDEDNDGGIYDDFLTDSESEIDEMA